jgi:hypothetical protein
VDQERDDYADFDLRPPLQWSRAWSAIVGLMVAFVAFVVLMLLMLFAYNLCRERPPSPPTIAITFRY